MEVEVMSLYELPENLIKAIVDEGMKTAWKESLSLPTETARTRAKAIIRKRIMESRGLRAFPEDAQMAARMFLEVGPLLAEHEAISKAVKNIRCFATRHRRFWTKAKRRHWRQQSFRSRQTEPRAFWEYFCGEWKERSILRWSYRKIKTTTTSKRWYANQGSGWS